MLEPIKHLIKERLGLSFNEYTEDALRRALEKRIGAELSPAAVLTYRQQLQCDELEWHELTSLLTVNETYFYRESEHLRLLTEVLTPQLLAGCVAGRPVRVLSVGCATGEEPYSIAIAVQERYGAGAECLFTIQAGDVDRKALKRAQAGVYGIYSFRALPAELMARYFTPVDAQHWQINPIIRCQVAFHYCNVLAETYPEMWYGQDVVFFRNVSIYFDPATRQAIQRRLHALLNPGGYLVVGATETLANDFGLLELQEVEGVFFFVKRSIRNAFRSPPALEKEWGSASISSFSVEKDLERKSAEEKSLERKSAISSVPEEKGLEGRTPISSLPSLQESEERMRVFPRSLEPRGGVDETCLSPLRGEKLALSDYQNALTLAREHRFDEALALLVQLCQGDEVPGRYWALQAHVLLERGDISGARTAVERALSRDPWLMEAWLIYGRIARVQGRVEEAIGHFRQVIYNYPECWLAHYHLAELYREGGKTALAKREYRIVLRQLADPERAQHTASALPLAISLQDLRLLCTNQLTRLAQTPTL